MAVTGTGTQADPFVVTTYAELVEKAAESGAYVKVGNDINITDEYPDGDMPTLTLSAVVDGDNRTISNWYLTASRSMINISNRSGRLKNLKLKNIYIQIDRPIFYVDWYPDVETEYYFTNCEFSGVTNYTIAATNYGGRGMRLFKKCSFNIKVTYASNDVLFDADFLNCYIHFHLTNPQAKVFSSSNTHENSYVEITADESAKNGVSLGSLSTFSNCVIDSNLTTVESLSVDSNKTLSIINSTHAPNYTVSGKLALVDDEHWLDTAYLASIGFNVG